MLVVRTKFIELHNGRGHFVKSSSADVKKQLTRYVSQPSLREGVAVDALRDTHTHWSPRPSPVKGPIFFSGEMYVVPEDAA